jgi:ribosomal protein S18 acetylase RimI-like enzyme
VHVILTGEIGRRETGKPALENEVRSMAKSAVQISALDEEGFSRHLEDLTEILWRCVHGGAAVSFVLPFSLEDARSFWLELVRPSLVTRKRIVIVASAGERVVGTVQLDLDTRPNQPDRADVAKMLVHPDFRRRGIGRAMMLDLEKRAAQAGRRLILLDTQSGGAAEVLYLSLGFIPVGQVPNYALNPTDAGYHAATIMYKTLS